MNRKYKSGKFTNKKIKGNVVKIEDKETNTANTVVKYVNVYYKNITHKKYKNDYKDEYEHY